MKYCLKCGKELADEAVVCMGCGCAVVENEESLQANEFSALKSRSKIKMIWIVLGAVALLLGIVAAILFVPRNLKMNDFKETNVVSAMMQYGLPESIDSDEDGGVFLRYGEKVDFYGITPYSFIVYPDENRAVFFFRDDDAYDVYDRIKHYCDFEENLLDIYHKFSYGNLKITTYAYDGGYVAIEIY